MIKASLIIAEDSKGNLSVPIIAKDKNVVLQKLPEILQQGYTAAHYIKNPSVRTFRNKGEIKLTEQKPQMVEPIQIADDVADELSDQPKRRGRPPKVS